MIEKTKADVYMTYLDLILDGQKDVEFVEDEEVKKLLLLAQTIVSADLSSNSKIKESLKKQLMAQIIEKYNSSVLKSGEYQLDEEDLMHVAAGFQGQVMDRNDTCPFCGSKLKGPGGKCPFCCR